MLSPKNLSLIDSTLDRWKSDKELHGFILIPYTDLETVLAINAVRHIFLKMLSNKSLPEIADYGEA